MKNRKMFDAMSGIDDKFIDRALQKRYADNAAAPREKRKPAAGYMPAVAAIVLIMAITLSAVMIAFRAKKPADAPDDRGQSLTVGFDTVNEPVVGARLAIRTESSKIAVGEDLTLSAYCVCGTKDDGASAVTAKLLMSYSRIDPDNMIQTVKVIEDGKAEGYTWNGSFDTVKSVDITVPASVFTKAEVEEDEEPPETDGVIVLSLDVSRTDADGGETEEQAGAALYYKIEGDEVYLNISDETMELARSAVEKLYRNLVLGLNLSSDFRWSLMDEYTVGKQVAPELIILETKKDAASAFIKLYEEMLVEYRGCDIDAYFDESIKISKFLDEHAPYPIAELKVSDEYKKVIRIHDVRLRLEALLSLDCYYDMLSEDEIERMMKDFDEYLKIQNTYTRKYYDQVAGETWFSICRRGAFGGSLVIIE